MRGSYREVRFVAYWALLLALVLGACSGSSGSGASEASATPADTATPAPTPTPLPVPISQANIGELSRLWARGMGEALTADYSPDGSRLAIGGPQGIWIYDAHSFEQLAHLTEHTNDVYAVAWSPDGRWLASGAADRNLIIWDAETLTPITSVEADFWVSMLAWAPDSQQLITAWSGYVYVLTLDGSQLAASDPEEDAINDVDWDRGAINDVDWSADGDHVALAASGGTFEMWSTGTREFERSLGHGGSVTEVAISPDGEFVATGDNSGNLRIVDTAEHDWWKFEVGEGLIANVRWSPDGNSVAVSGYDGTVTIWDRDAWDIDRQILIHQDKVGALAWSPDGGQLLTGSEDGTVRIWDTSNWSEVAQLEGHITVGYELEFSPDSQMLAASVLGNDKIEVLNSRDGAVLEELSVGDGSAWGLAWSPDGARLAGVSSEGLVSIWNTSDWTVFTTLQANEEPLYSVAWSPDSALLGAGSSEGTFWAWDVQSGELVPTDRWEERGHVRALAWSPDGSILLVGFGDSTVMVYSSEDLTHPLVGHVDVDSERPVMDLDWSPDGSRILVARQYQPIQGFDWDKDRGEVTSIVRFRGHSGYPYTASFAVDSNLVASGSNEDELLIWDYASLEVLATLEGFYGWIYSVDWSPDGNYLAAGDNAGQVVVYAIPTQ